MTKLAKFIYTTVSAFTLLSCSSGQNFTQFPGFTEHFAKYPPADTAPSQQEKALLAKFKPKIYLAADQPRPVDFYRDYISNGKLSADNKQFTKVTATILNQHRGDTKALFKYTGDYRKSGFAPEHTSKVYARIDYEKIEHDEQDYDFAFLTYNLVFPVSGILKGLGALQSFGLTVGGNLNDWHQLDHYVGLSVAVLDGEAIAVTVQQHNYHTTYLPDDSRLANGSYVNNTFAVDFAHRSNELYPHSSEHQQPPAVSFLTSENLEFVMTGKNKPMMAGFDHTHGETQLDYTLEYLPQTDAFYQFKGSLGKNRLLPGRSGPPGADYATLPGLMPRFVRLITGYRPGPVEQEIELYNELFDRENFAVRANAIGPFKARFFETILNDTLKPNVR